MKIKNFCHTIGRVVIIEALLLVLPLIVSLIYRERSVFAFLNTILIACVVGVILLFFFPSKRPALSIHDGFAIAALAWIAMSLIGALPFVISKEIPSYIDAIFETVSGFTTTGASIVDDVEKMSHGILFWRSFTHWVGGMGMLVFIMALSNKTPDRSTNLLRGEMPGHSVDKLLPKASSTAKILYCIYIVLTFIEVIFLLFGGMPLFDSVVHALGTAGTGGFGIKADSIASYSPYLQWVITIFMLLFGMSFNMFYLMLIRKWDYVRKSNELWTYLSIFFVSTVLISANIYHIYGNLSDTIRTSAFQVSSIITTTGYATADFDLWPQFSKMILLILMFIGGCMGSTAGGIKVSRVVVLHQSARNSIRRTINPRSVNRVKLNGSVLDEAAERSFLAYLALYVHVFMFVFIVISFEPLGFETNFSAVASCFNNIGPGFAACGPTANFNCYSAFSKVVLSIAMLMGRLEIYPLLSLFIKR